MLKTDAHPWESVFVLHIMKASSMRRIRFLTDAKMYPFFCPEVVVFVVLSVVKCVVEAWGHDFSPGPHFLRDRVVSASSPGMAAQYPFQRQPESLEGSIFPEGLQRVLGAGRSETAAGRLERGYADLIESYESREGQYGQFPESVFHSCSSPFALLQFLASFSSSSPTRAYISEYDITSRLL